VVMLLRDHSPLGTVHTSFIRAVRVSTGEILDYASFCLSWSNLGARKCAGGAQKLLSFGVVVLSVH
jgi:hypothetical protein